MDDLFTELGRQINNATKKILTPEEMASLKADVRKAGQDISQAAQDVAREVGKAAGTFWNPPRSGTEAPPQWSTFSPQDTPARKPPAPPRRTRQQPSQPAGQREFRNFSPAQAPGKAGKKTKWKKADPGGMGVAAVILLGIGLLTLGGGFEELFSFSFYSPIASIINTAFAFVPSIGCLTASGICFGRMRYLKRAQNYQKQLKGVDYAAVKDMAQFFSLPEDRVRSDLKRMMSDGMLRDCYFDDQQTCLILSREVYDQYLSLQENLRQKQLEAERAAAIRQEDPDAAAAEELRRTGEEYIRKIRQINIDLPEQEISAKLDSLEKICTQIFDYVSKNPEKMPQIRKFMSYYLPTTLKFSEAYRDLELKAVQTDEIQATKAEIRQALDNINLAFQKLYANLMQKDLMGLSADISALETMLSQEGLIDNDLSIS